MPGALGAPAYRVAFGVLKTGEYAGTPLYAAEDAPVSLRRHHRRRHKYSGRVSTVSRWQMAGFDLLICHAFTETLLNNRGATCLLNSRWVFFCLRSERLCRFASNLQFGKASIKFFVAHFLNDAECVLHDNRAIEHP